MTDPGGSSPAGTQTCILKAADLRLKCTPSASSSRTAESETVALFDNYAAGLSRFAVASGVSSDLAQDAVQEVFLCFFEARSHGRVIKNPKAWLFAKLRCVVESDVKLNEKHTGKLPVSIATSDMDPEMTYRMQESANAIERMLSPRELQCLRLSAEGFQHDEIAEILGISTGNVGARLSRVVRRLRQGLGKGKS